MKKLGERKSVRSEATVNNFDDKLVLNKTGNFKKWTEQDFEYFAKKCPLGNPDIQKVEKYLRSNEKTCSSAMVRDILDARVLSLGNAEESADGEIHIDTDRFLRVVKKILCQGYPRDKLLLDRFSILKLLKEKNSYLYEYLKHHKNRSEVYAKIRAPWYIKSLNKEIRNERLRDDIFKIIYKAKLSSLTEISRVVGVNRLKMVRGDMKRWGLTCKGQVQIVINILANSLTIDHLDKVGIDQVSKCFAYLEKIPSKEFNFKSLEGVALLSMKYNSIMREYGFYYYPKYS